MGERTFDNARVALKTQVRMEIEEVAGSLFKGRLIYMYPSDTTARLVRKIEGTMYDKYIIITKSVETYLMDPRSRSFWSDCSHCPGASSFYIENNNLVLKIEATSCGDSCNGETVFRRKLYTYDSATQVVIVKQLNLNKGPIKFKPFTNTRDSVAYAIRMAKLDSLKYFPVLLKEDMSIHFDPGKYVLPAITTTAAHADKAPAAINDTGQNAAVKHLPVMVKDSTAILLHKRINSPKPVLTKEVRKDTLKQQKTIAAGIAKDTVAPAPVIKDSVPAAVTQRNTKLITTYEVSSPHILVQLFDDGQIDGDAVSVYYNGTLIINNRTLTHKAITFNLEATAENRHHEFILISESVGFMAPNTALMRITAGEQKFELTVSSNMEHNAKIAIDYTGN